MSKRILNFTALICVLLFLASCPGSSAQQVNPLPSLCFTYGIDQARTGYVDFEGPTSADINKATVVRFHELLSKKFTSSSMSMSTGGALYFESWDGALLAYTVEGRELWSISDMGGVATPVILPDGRLIVVTQNKYIYLLNPDRSAEWKLQLDDEIFSTPVYKDEFIYVASKAGTLYCIDYDGNPQWDVDTGMTVNAPLALADEYLVVTSIDGKIEVYELSGIRKASMQLAGRTNNCAAVHDHVIYITDSTTAYAFSVDGRELWKKPLSNTSLSSPSVSKSGLIYIGGEDYLYILDKAGNILKQVSIRGTVNSKPIVDKIDNVYLPLTNYGSPCYIACIDKNGKDVWYMDVGDSIPNPVVIDRYGRLAFTTAGNNLIITDPTHQ